LSAVACATGDLLAKVQGEASSKEDVLKALSHASSELRTKLGESLPSVQEFGVPLEVTTSSIEALKSYSMAINVYREQGEAASIPFYKRAIELDPNFPMAYADLAEAYANLGQPSLALEYATKAYQLRDRVTERERLRITAAYFLPQENWTKNRRPTNCGRQITRAIPIHGGALVWTTCPWGNMTRRLCSVKKRCDCRPETSATIRI
jgi:tetratricopeptide (TPR) repeat protein